MGTTPDQYRDYNILASVPDMVDIMKVEYVRLDNVIKMFGEDVNGGTKTFLFCLFSLFTLNFIIICIRANKC